ncbi:hypothetical protein THASP1DRAFT_20642 [Thamnocephalis sphaerospora]|uniref:Nephrocystin 3-like N-terminal domain-containing protein n=1 Tax=Thamnocephalis sphaerospora TaxID=78915 RepID=A0A4P9XGQ3_9FUNG|nr:hypothetical protein THASP1DRAFT_20642 [Thamnocephalis sphaerospora]|eukprot:RKP04824.1 hypothetical protein THASP1DRAFT_20642 [Thamnocephalis sphaerospora]
MDPLTTLSTTCNALQLFQLAWKLVASSRDIYSSGDGTTLSTKAIEGVANAVTKLSDSVLGECDLPDELHELSRLSKDVAGKLSALLCKVTAQCPHSKWQSFRAALKETWSKGQIREFTDQLQQLQIQAIASIQFLIMMGATFHVALDQLRRDIMNQLGGLQEIRWRETMRHVLGDLGQLTLEQPVDLNTISAQLNTLSLSISQLQRDMKDTRSYQNVLRTVGFDRLRFRHDRIERAHAETFSWVFEDHAAAVRGRVSLHFRDWLRNRDGIFWIRGKAGSGKSTLMKFLCGDGRTRDNLLGWSRGPQHLVVAKYFFWSAGTPIQKSQEGLMRSLIYDILCQRPERIPLVQKRLAQRHDEIQEGENIWSWEFLLGTLSELITVNSAE